MKTVVFDLDGTLANVDHRVHLVRRDKPDWDAFYSSCDKDVPNQWCVAMMDAFYFSRSCNIAIVSARRRSEFKKTSDWLSENDIGFNDLFLLRDEGNNEPDTVLKKRWLDKFGKENILFVVDDRQKVVDMWRAEGLTCLQCSAWEEFKKEVKI